jgi:hypothetical protein
VIERRVRLCDADKDELFDHRMNQRNGTIIYATDNVARCTHSFSFSGMFRVKRSPDGRYAALKWPAIPSNSTEPTQSSTHSSEENRTRLEIYLYYEFRDWRIRNTIP